MKRKNRNLGLSLIEFIVAFAILGVAVLGIGSFYVASARNSSKINSDSDLQNEAQLAVNQMESMIQDADLGVSYRVVTDILSDADRDKYFVLNDSDSEISGNITSKTLYIIKKNDVGSLVVDLFKWDVNTKEIQYQQMLAGTASAIWEIDPASSAWELLAEDVTGFSAELDENGKKITLNFTFENSKDKYEITKTITFRNSIVVVKKDTNLDDLSSSINTSVAAKITEVKINIAPKILAPGAQVQLSSEVLGNTNVSQNIYKWVVATDERMNNEIGDSLDATDPVTVSGGNLGIDFSGFATIPDTVYVQALVANGVDASGNTQYMASNVEALKVVTDMALSIDGTRIASIGSPGNRTAETGKTYYLDVIYGGNLTAAEKSVKWTIEPNTGDVDATISSNGKLEIDEYSENVSFTVVATSAKNSSVKVECKFTVSSSVVSSGNLSLSGKGTLNRGAQAKYLVKLNGTTIDPEDCDWTVSVTGGSGGSSNVTVGNTGVVSVKDSLPYGNSYTLTVKAALKSNSSINATITVNVPKVALKMTASDTEASRGDTIKGFKCTVDGLEEYEVKWSMARSTSPSKFFTVSGNTRITSKINGGVSEAEVLFGSDEAADVFSITVKAELVGKSSYSEKVTVDTLPEFTIYVTQGLDSTKIRDGGNIKVFKSSFLNLKDIQYYVYPNCTIENGDSDNITIEITETGVTLKNGYFIPKTSGVQIEIKATYKGTKGSISDSIKVNVVK